MLEFRKVGHLLQPNTQINRNVNFIFYQPPPLPPLLSLTKAYVLDSAFVKLEIRKSSERNC